MSTQFTTADVLALAPDSASIKAGQDLAFERKWVSLAASDTAIWGECQGSGKTPYQTTIDLTDPAFKCSCPSRKFPCKHGLALMLLYVKVSSAFTRAKETPGWAEEWLLRRSEKAQAKEERALTATSPVPGPERDSRRAEQRQAKVAAGVADLGIWLQDLIRQGLAELPAKGYSYWDNMAARMVDCQAPGAARILRELGGLPTSGKDWQTNFLERISLLHLLLQGFKNIDVQSVETAADIKSALGWTTPVDELFALSGIADRWVVCGQRIVEEDRLKARRTWIMGEASHKRALLLHFAHGSSPFDSALVTGTIVTGELVYYPGSAPLRAAIKAQVNVSERPTLFPTSSSITDELLSYMKHISSNPWIERVALSFHRVRTAVENGQMLLVDENNDTVPIRSADLAWRLHALTGGWPCNVFGEWDGSQFFPLSASDETGIVQL